MSIFGKIMSAIFGTKADAAPAGGARPRTPDRPVGLLHRPPQPST